MASKPNNNDSKYIKIIVIRAIVIVWGLKHMPCMYPTLVQSMVPHATLNIAKYNPGALPPPLPGSPGNPQHPAVSEQHHSSTDALNHRLSWLRIWISRTPRSLEHCWLERLPKIKIITNPFYVNINNMIFDEKYSYFPKKQISGQSGIVFTIVMFCKYFKFPV